MTTCNICISPFNKSTKQLITCLKCDKGCCLSCVKTFLKSTLSEPTCMFCSETLSKYDLIKMKLPKTYLEREYKLIRQEILFNNDKVHYSHTFKYVPEWVSLSKKQKEGSDQYNYSKKYIEGANSNPEACNYIKSKIYEFNRLSKSLVDDGKDVHYILKRLHVLSKDNEMIEYKKHQELLEISRVDLINTWAKIKGMKRILKSNDNEKIPEQCLTLFCQEDKCNGMLDKDSKCITCNQSYCVKCDVKLMENHQCNESDVKSFNLIKKQSKSCPKCFIPIYKIHGCDQMFCTGCFTPFSWNTGKILKSTNFFHNPHYFDHLNNGGENIFNNLNPEHEPPISWGELSTKFRKNSKDSVHIRDLYRRLLELIDIKLNRFTIDPCKKIERVKFLSNDITKEEYKKFLIKEDKKIELLYNIDKIYELFYHKVFDCLKNLDNSSSNIQELKVQLQIIKHDCINCINNICHDFGNASRLHNQKIINCIPRKL